MSTAIEKALQNRLPAGSPRRIRSTGACTIGCASVGPGSRREVDASCPGYAGGGAGCSGAAAAGVGAGGASLGGDSGLSSGRIMVKVGQEQGPERLGGQVGFYRAVARGTTGSSVCP